mgnify:FL=1
MLVKKMLRTAWQYKAQFISMVLMVMLGVGMFVGFNMEWASIEENMFSFFEDSKFADYRLVSEKGYSEDDLGKIAALDGVEAASRFLSVNVDVKDTGGDSVALAVTTDPAVSSFVLISGEAYDGSSADGIWLSDRYAEENGVSVGDTVTFVYRNTEISGKVKGLIKAAEQMICVRDKTQLMPDFATHGFVYISPVMYEKALGFAYYPQINVISSLEKDDFSEKVNKALGQTTVILTKDETLSYSQAEGEVSEGKAMGSILPALFLLIGLLTMVTTMHRLTAKEKTQIGTLKALGFHDSRITRHYTSFAFFVAALGTALGIGMGYGVAWIIMNPNGMMGTYLDLPKWKLVFPAFCAVAVALIIAALTLIGFLSVRRMLVGTAADALRPYTPKKMKPMLIERTKFFHKLSFGTRWNMRDIVRHKARTAMSLVGIVGCTILILASFGMKDTMNAFLDMYYDNGLNYSSRIFLSETATDAEKQEIIDKYKGDFGGSVSVQLDEKTVSLDIYDITHDKIRIMDENTDKIEIGDGGAYICMRLAEEFGLGVGDTFTVSPFGTSDTYKLKVAGIFRSVSENVIISDKYASELNLPYTVDSVYTDTEKSDIALSDVIKSVQSKQMIMDSFEAFLSIMDTMIYLLVGGALLLGIIVLYNLGTMSYTERYREMATLKVVGFRDKKIGRLLSGQNLALSVVGIIIGIPLGALTLSYLLKTLASEYEMKMAIGAGSYIFTVILTVGMSLLVSLMVARKNKNIDMVEALKGQE